MDTTRFMLKTSLDNKILDVAGEEFDLKVVSYQV
jgi:hypothetical protein